MKRCRSCDQTFDEEWLSFCTKDGTALIEDAESASEPPPTILAPPPNLGQSDLNLPVGGFNVPARQFAEQPIQPAWQPPPPPSYAQPESKGLATASMVLGIISVTVGWMCFGPVPAIIAIVLGLVALSQIKKHPDRVGGKALAWTGIIAGGLTVLIYGGIMIFYIIVIAFGAANR